MEIVAKSKIKAHPIQDNEIPPALIYEEEDGQPIYYRGYKNVLAGTKTLEEIMGCSSLQSETLRLLLKYLYANVDEAGFQVYTNEPGMHISKGNNRANDIAIYRAEDLAGYKFDDKYFQIPPFIGVEVDIKADISESKWEIYLKKKTKRLLDWGVHQVIWIFTPTRQIIIAEAGKDWLIRDWDKDFEIAPEHSINLDEMLTKSSMK